MTYLEGRTLSAKAVQTRIQPGKAVDIFLIFGADVRVVFVFGSEHTHGEIRTESLLARRSRW
jgi:hypothetical protein